MRVLTKLRLSVIIPVYNEEYNIGNVLDEIMQIIGIEDELIVIDDGSTDRTVEVVEKRKVRVIRHIANQGKGFCLREGIGIATGDLVLFIDGDGQDDPADIPKLISPFYEGTDFVNGSRWLGSFQEGAISWLNFFVTTLITKAINILFNANITDSQAGFRCFRKDKLKGMKLVSNKYEIETEMLIKAIKHGLKIVEIPVKRFKRPVGESKLRRLQTGTRILWVILKEKLLNRY